MSSYPKKSKPTGEPSSSKGNWKHPSEDASYEVALRAPRHEGELSGRLENTAVDHPARSECPKAILEDLEAVQDFLSKVMVTSCCKCGGDLIYSFSAAAWFKKWDDDQRSHKIQSLSTARCSQERCRALTCLGCGKGPTTSKYRKNVGRYDVEWCCTKGRLFAVWVLLCKYDEVELAVQFQSTKSHKPSGANPAHQNAPAPKAGTGYAKDEPAFYSKSNFGLGGYRQTFVPPRMALKNTDAETDDITGSLFSLVTALLPLYPDREPPQGLYEMIELSFFPDRAAQLLRNDSLDDVSKRGALYHSLLSFVEKVGNNDDTCFLVTDDRWAKKKSPGLEVLSKLDVMGDGKGKGKGRSRNMDLLEVEKSKKAMSWSLLQCMDNLGTQSASLLRTAGGGFRDDMGKEVLALAKRISTVYEGLKTKLSREQRHAMKPSTDSWKEYHAANRVEYTNIVMVNTMPRIQASAQQMRESPRDRIRKITMELVDMSTSLPEGIFLQVQEERPDVMKSIIVGPGETPYHGGLFEFDIFCGPNYPHSPPTVVFRTTNGGRVRFNPNLHTDGKGIILTSPYFQIFANLSQVCLSLLGTWPPRSPEEEWQPGKSTILQVLISIQAMIFTADPYENEPDAEQRMHPHDFKVFNQRMILKVQASTVRFAMLDWLSQGYMRNGIWHDLVTQYFALNSENVKAIVHNWAATNRGIQSYGEGETGGVEPGGRRAGLFSRPARLDLLQQLMTALDKERQPRKHG
ncbi:hypothetical protein MMC30_006875 [Trapelia coarctata]|nr:hypothetical protein [Trapelia coarctata]